MKKNEARFDKLKNNVENQMLFDLNDQEMRVSVSVHFYHTKQKLMIQGTRFLKFVDRFFQPFLEHQIKKEEENISKANNILKFASKNTLKDAETEPELKKRKRHDRPSVQIECDRCPEELVSNRALRIHKKKEHTSVSLQDEKRIKVKSLDYIPEFPCKKCTEIFFTKDKLNSHIIVAHSNNSELPIVPEEKDTIQETKKHELKSPEEIRVAENKCKQCGKNFQQKEELKSHQQSIHSLLSCNRCQYTCRTNMSLKRHEASFYCDSCQICVPSSCETDLIVHYYEHVIEKENNKKKRLKQEVMSEHVKTLDPQAIKSLIDKSEKLKGDDTKKTQKEENPEENLLTTEEENHSCPMCDFKSTYLAHIWEHMARAHKDRVPPLKTEIRSNFLISLVAEQNVDISNDLLVIKKGTLEAFKELERQYEKREQKYDERESFMFKLVKEVSDELKNIKKELEKVNKESKKSSERSPSTNNIPEKKDTNGKDEQIKQKKHIRNTMFRFLIPLLSFIIHLPHSQATPL